ncbi:MAG: ribosomal-processing cysteine protease Prp [Eubacterium sp.]|nr:ribosomal-processing cysteine protease Prp [Eubacterium sp.]
MLKIQIDRNVKTGGYRLKMKGHCGFDKEGRDIVCAAASILCLSMAQVLRENKDKLEDKPRIIIHNGKCLLEWQPKARYEGALLNSLYTVKAGLRVLQNEYPDYIEMRE